jgi:hypothetical protein
MQRGVTDISPMQRLPVQRTVLAIGLFLLPICASAQQHEGGAFSRCRRLSQSSDTGQAPRFHSGEVTRNHRHRRLRTRMIAVALLLKATLQAEIGWSAQTRNVFDIRIVTGIAGHDTAFRISRRVDRPSPRIEIAVAVISGLEWDPSKHVCQIASRIETQSCNSPT